MGLILTLVALATSASLAGTARADVYAPSDFAPSVWSDQPDYAPGDTVHLSGAHWQPGESVHIRVNDDAGSTWSRDADVTADDAGAISDSFNLPDWFVAQYSVTASGASGSTARTSFTDANLKVNGTFVGSTTDTFTLTYTRWSGTACGGTARSGDPLTAPVGIAAFTVPQSGQDSVTLSASSTSAGGRPFVNWKDSSGVVISTNATVCVDFPAGGTEKTYTATYGAGNSAPTVAANNASVSVNEGQSAGNTGTYSDANTGDNVTISASRGTVTKTGTNSGTWTWSLATTDGPDQTGPVTITADDGHGATTTTNFTLNVANVAPTVTLAAGNPTSVNEGPTQHTYSYTISDPGADTVSSVTTSCGANGSKVAGSDTNTNTSGSFECTFADGPSTSVVSASATDSDSATGNLATQAVTVDNVAPTASVTGAATADEGDTKTYTFTVSDPGDDAFVVDAGFPDCDAGATNNGTFVAGSLSVNASGGSFQCFFADGPATANVKIQVRDSDGASDAASQSVQIVAVANVAPTVTAAANQTANEGASKSFALGSFTDPGADSPWAVDVDWGDGSSHSTFNMTLTGSLGSLNHTYADGPATRTVSVEVTDKNGAGDTKSFEVAVANVAPTVTLAAGNHLSVDEGSTHTYSYTISDPGVDTVASVTTSCGANGTKSDATNTNSSGSFKCTFPDGPASSTVSASATDSDGDTGAADTQTVSVANVAPTVTLAAGNDLSVSEGSTHTYSYSISDPGADTVSSVTTSCGANGSKVGGSDTNTDSSGSFECSFPDGPASSVVSASATDSDGAAGNLDTQSVAVANVAPTVNVTGAANVDEGSTHTYSFTVTDPGDDTFAASAGFPDCDAGATDNGTLVSGSYSATAGGGSFKCAFPDGPATASVKMKVADSDGASGTDSESVQVVAVANVAPSVTAAADQDANEGASQSFALGSFTDPGPDSPWAVDVDWGDGSAHTTFDAASTGSLGTKSHTYDDGPATRTVSVKVTDKNNDSDTKTFTVEVANIAPSADLGNNGPKPEGSAVTVALTNAADPSSGDTGAGFRYGFACTASDALPTSYAAAGTSASKSCTFADNGAYTVQGRVFDRDSGYRTYETTVTVTNVAPTITSFTGTNSLAGSLVFAPSTFKTDFTDPGTVDTHKADFTWSSGLPATQTVSPFTTGQKVDHTFTAGCNRTATVKVTDKDGDSDSKSTSVSVGTGTWLPPLADQPVSDKLKNGQVLPVKVKIADCNGVSVGGLSPVIQLLKGDLTTVNDDSAEVITISSVSAADTGTTMRPVDGYYMYNLRVGVASGDLGKDFTIVIYPYGTGSPQTLRHVIVPVK